MVAQYVPTDDELYLYALLTDPSGIDLAEFAWVDEGKDDKCFRLWDFQWPWYRDRSLYQADQASRTLGKSVGIAMRACAHPFNFPGQERLITAPELNHLRPLVDAIEKYLKSVWFLREMCPSGQYMGIARQPQWQIRFLNGAEIRSRLPQRTGVGVKGNHPVVIELDECFPAGTLVLTRRGQVPIESVSLGDLVLTHRNRWRRVTAVMDRGVRDAVIVRGQGHPGLVTTADHKFWVRRIEVFHDARNRWGAKRVSDDDWVYAADLGDCLWATPVRYPRRSIPPGPDRAATGASRPVSVSTERFAWALGLYLAEGSTSRSSPKLRPNKVTWSVHRREVDEVVSRLRACGLAPYVQPVRNTAECLNVVVASVELAGWLTEHCGKGARHKQVPAWVLSAPESYRIAVLAGLVYGDGYFDPDQRYAPGRWKLTTASKAMAVSARLLALTLGYHVSLYEVPRKRPAVIRGREINSGLWYQVVGNSAGQLHFDTEHARGRVREVSAVEPVPMFDLTVEEDHSFVADGIVVSNCQDYPDAGYDEILECLKEEPGAQFRMHGVPKGLRDRFWKWTTGQDPNLPFTVHRKMAMERPTWNDLERRRKIALYGGRMNPNYRRNLYGEHGDATSPLFVLARLMQVVDQDDQSDYNLNVYSMLSITDEDIRAERGSEDPADTSWIDSLVEPHVPRTHLLGYSGYWGGGDIGVTNHPSEFLVAGQIEKKSALRLLLRLHLERVKVDDQMALIRWLKEFYDSAPGRAGLVGFGIDRAGPGFGVWQPLSDTAIEDGLLREHRTGAWVHGWDFMEKIVAALDETKGDESGVEEQLIYRYMIDYASEELRRFVDVKNLLLPADNDLINQFQGQTYTSAKGKDLDPNRPKRTYSKGTFHALDAAKYLIATRTLPSLHRTIVAALDKKPARPRTVFPGAYR